MELEASTGAIRLAPPIRSNVNLEAKVGVSVTDGKNEARSNFQVKGTQSGFFFKGRGVARGRGPVPLPSLVGGCSLVACEK